MKHLKTYEKYTLLDIKKYVIVKYYNKTDNKVQYFIDIIHEIKDNDYIKFEIIYEYNDMNKKIEKVVGTAPTSTYFSNYLGEIIFTSNNLDECITFLYEYVNATKYNL